MRQGSAIRIVNVFRAMYKNKLVRYQRLKLLKSRLCQSSYHAMLLSSLILPKIILECPNRRNRDPTKDHNCNRKPNLLQSIYNRRIELESMRVINSTRVLCVQGERKIVHRLVSMKPVLEIGCI